LLHVVEQSANKRLCLLSTCVDVLLVLQMEQMQLQAKKGRSLYNSSSTAGRRGGSTTPPGQLQGPAGSLGMGLSSSGITAFADTSSSGLGAAGVATLDGAGGQQQAGGGSWSQRR
jgi:hypothetical protein